MNEKLLSTTDIAKMLGLSRTSAWRVCEKNLGFSIKFGRGYKVPESHMERVMLGETPEAIADDVRSRRKTSI